MTTIMEIIEDYIKNNKYDGLQNNDMCGCRVGDLMPCGSPNMDCMVGYIQKCSNCDLYINKQCENGWNWCIGQKIPKYIDEEGQ